MAISIYGYEYDTYKGHDPKCNTPTRKEHIENNLFLKYYLRMANFNKVIKVLNINSAVSLQCTSARDGIETTHSIAKYH